MKEIQEILQKNNLVRTSCREEIIKVIAASPISLSEDEIKSSINGNFDRTTFYRTFKTLISKGIIHKIVIDNTLVKYALSQDKNTEENHAHFYCLKCQKVYCVPQVKWEYSQLPDMYDAVETELLIKGYCNSCKKKS